MNGLGSRTGGNRCDRPAPEAIATVWGRGRRPERHGGRVPPKEDLVAEALPAGLPRLDPAPDPGSVREDLPALTRRARDAMYSRPGFASRSIIHECDPHQTERFRSLILEGVVGPTVRLLREVVRRGIERGEACSGAANGCVLDAVPAMTMYRSKMCGSEWSDREIEEMIDQIMPPLLRPDAG